MTESQQKPHRSPHGLRLIQVLLGCGELGSCGGFDDGRWWDLQIAIGSLDSVKNLKL